MVVEQQNQLLPSEKFEQCSLKILRLIKDAQQQHGLRHGDYQRYRGYCSRRIRRLRKVLKMPQGDRRHFKKRDVSEQHLLKSDDERFLYVPLMLAERCWAYAMQLRQESNTEPRKKFHLVQKLRKACIYAIQLEELCNKSGDRCDARTKLEAQAYVAWIQGSLQFELELWLNAMENLKKCQIIYEKLIATLPDVEQLPYKQRIDEIMPSLRYCSYNITDNDDNGSDQKTIDLLELRSQGILENFNDLLKQTKKEQLDQVVLHEINWFNLKIPIRNERIRLFLSSIENLNESLKNCDLQGKIKILENLLIDLRDIINLVRDEIKTESQLLLIYLLSIRVERTTERNFLLIQQTKKPQDCVRLLDIIVQQTIELSQNDEIKTNAEIQEYYQKQIDIYKLIRTYYMARLFAEKKRFKESAILYDLICKEMSKLSTKLTFKLNELNEMLLIIRNNCEIDKVNAQANYLLIDLQQNDEQLLPNQQQQQKLYKTKKPLIDRLTEFRGEDQQLLTKSPNLVHLPPQMQPIPTKPLFYDLALNFIQFPDLSHKLDGVDDGKSKQQMAGISGFVKGLWGWGKK